MAAHRKLTLLAYMVLATLLTPSKSEAWALFGSNIDIAGQTVLKDHELPHVYYLVPPPPSIAIDDEGKPEVHLSLTYYSGTELRNDIDKKWAKWRLHIELVRASISRSTRNEIIAELSNIGQTNRSIVLRDLPIISVPTEVTYSSIDTPESQISLSKAEIVGSDPAIDRSPQGDQSYWTRRVLSFSLSENDGTAMRAAFDAGGSLMAISSAYRAVGVLAQDTDKTSSDYVQTSNEVSSSAVRIQIDKNAYPEYLRIIDLNSVSPPGYVGLTFLCYDFSDVPNLDTVLFKKVELEAAGVTGRVIKTSIAFQRSKQGITQRFAKFPHAVRVDQPFRYRVKTYDLAGVLQVGPWISINNWITPIDVTSYQVESDEESTSASSQSALDQGEEI